MHPFSATTAWRTGGRADIFRTTDGTQWADVANPAETLGLFVAIDPRTATYADIGSTLYVTKDAGATWHPILSGGS